MLANKLIKLLNSFILMVIAGNLYFFIYGIKVIDKMILSNLSFIFCSLVVSSNVSKYMYFVHTLGMY